MSTTDASSSSSSPPPETSASSVPPYINLGPPAATPAEDGQRAPPAPRPHPEPNGAPIIKLRPQRLIILCDGTWQARLDVEAHEDTGVEGKTATGKDGWLKAGSFFTNVSLLAQVLEPVGIDQDGNEIRQTVLYQSGIGAVPSLIGRYVEGATGSTLPSKVMEAYGFVCDNYRPVGPDEEPDKIYLFGFSRGAYTARTIAGFLAWAGVMTRQQCATHFPAIWDAYHARDASDPDTLAHADDVFFQRLGKFPSPYASHAAQVAKDNARLLRTSALKRFSTLVAPQRGPGWDQKFKPTQRDPSECAVSAPIEVVGVWDTVGALGTPGRFELPEMARYHSFFDPIPAPTIKYALHALALGEDREDFSPTLWVRPAGPGRTADGKLANNPSYHLESLHDTVLREKQTVRQVWFKGSHSDVGGHYSWHGLSDITLAWMVGQLVDAEGGPLLSINLDKLRNLQDRRRPWGRQPEHPSRGAFQFQKFRSVMPYLSSKVKAQLEAARKQEGRGSDGATNEDWRNVVEAGDTFESLHHSVTLGDEYAFEAGGSSVPGVFSKLFGSEDGPTKLRQLWKEAQSHPPTGTEASLMWSLTGPQLHDPNCETIVGLPVSSRPLGQEVDLDLRPEKPAWLPSLLWQVFMWALEWPLRLSVMAANILNGKVKFWELHEKNLGPSWTTRLLQAAKTWPAKLRQARNQAHAAHHPAPRARALSQAAS